MDPSSILASALGKESHPPTMSTLRDYGGCTIYREIDRYRDRVILTLTWNTYKKRK